MRKQDRIKYQGQININGNPIDLTDLPICVKIENEDSFFNFKTANWPGDEQGSKLQLTADSNSFWILLDEDIIDHLKPGEYLIHVFFIQEDADFGGTCRRYAKSDKKIIIHE